VIILFIIIYCLMLAGELPTEGSLD